MLDLHPRFGEVLHVAGRGSRLDAIHFPQLILRPISETNHTSLHAAKCLLQFSIQIRNVQRLFRMAFFDPVKYLQNIGDCHWNSPFSKT